MEKCPCKCYYIGREIFSENVFKKFSENQCDLSTTLSLFHVAAASLNTTSVFEIRENEQYTTNTNTIFIQTQSLYTINYMNASDNYYFFLAIEGNASCNSLLVYNTYTLYFDKTCF